MKSIKMWTRALIALLLMTAACGVLYTGLVTGIAQIAFPHQANGSIVKTDDGKQYCMVLGQTFEDDDHMWGRIQNYNATTFTDEEGNALMWAGASNLSPASGEFAALVQERVEKIRAAHPERSGEPIPNDLVTCSGSGLDPHISPAAAEYQVERLAKNTGKSVDEIREIIAKCTDGPQLGILGDAGVNVLKVNLMLDGVLG